jgi:hypothetical protein
MFLTAAAVSLLLAAGPGGDPRPGLWQTNGPAYPAIDLIAIAPDDENVVYAGANDPASGKSALFRSRDAGESWETVAEAPAGETLSQLAIDPTGPERILGLTASAPRLFNLFRTDDSGATWQLQDSFGAVTALFFDPTHPNTAILASRDGLFYSEMGSRWYPFRQGTPPPVSAWASPAGKVFWEAESYYDCNPGSWFPSPEHFQISFRVVGTQDAGCASDVSFPCPIHRVTFAPGRANIAYATAESCAPFLASHDGSSRWTPIDSVDLNRQLNRLSGGTVAGIAVQPQDALGLFVSLISTQGSPAGILVRSDDGGEHWDALAVPATPTGALAISPSGCFLYVGTDAGVYRLSLTRTRELAPRD